MPRTALVVDDSKSARFALRRYLEGQAFKVDTADSARQAYAALQQQRPDLIFLDHIMPEIDGFEALRQLKQDPATASIPIVICSSNEGEAFAAEAREQGAADVLPKPPTPDLLQRVLASVERLASQRDIEQSLDAAGELDDAEALPAEPAPAAASTDVAVEHPASAASAGPAPEPSADAGDHGTALAELREAVQALRDQPAPEDPRIAELDARIGALEKRIDHELVALRGQLTRDLEEITQRVLGHVSDALLRALGRS